MPKSWAGHEKAQDEHVHGLRAQCSSEVTSYLGLRTEGKEGTSCNTTDAKPTPRNSAEKQYASRCVKDHSAIAKLRRQDAAHVLPTLTEWRSSSLSGTGRGGLGHEFHELCGLGRLAIELRLKTVVRTDAVYTAVNDLRPGLQIDLWTIRRT